MKYRNDLRGNPHIMVYVPDDYSNKQVGVTTSEHGYFIEGGPDQPYTAAVIYRSGIAPASDEK